MPRRQGDLQALRNMIAEAHQILSTLELPEGRAERCAELLNAAVQLTDDLLSTSPAAQLGQKGGQKTAERGPEYFRKIASTASR
jgi:hypothetical protein